MGTKYSTVTIVGYNATPPADDGSTTASNEISWSKHKTKLGDPIKTLAEAINTALLTHTDESVLNISIARTTVAADHKRTINVTAAVTQSLGDAAALGVGYIVTIKNSHTASITVDLATGADTLDGTAAGSVSLAPGNAMTFAVNAGADGFKIQQGVFEDMGLKAYSETSNSYSITTGTKALDTSVASYFYASGAMTAVAYTFQFDNPPESGLVRSIIVELNSAGTASGITWPASVDWLNGGTEPSWSAASIDIAAFTTRDGGTTWLGYLGGLDFA